MKNAQAQAIFKPWLVKDYQPLKQSFKQAISSHLAEFQQKHPSTTLYGLSIYTCNGFPHFGIVLNTEKQLTTAPEDEQNYYKFCTDEWYSDNNSDSLDSANATLESLHDEFDALYEQFEEIALPPLDDDYYEEEEYWELNVKRIFNAALSALCELKDEQCFCCLGNSPVILIWFTDPDDWEMDMCVESAYRLCDKETFAQIFKTFKPDEQSYQP